MLERFVEDGSNSIVLRHLASGYLPCCLGSLRVGNAQHCWIPLQLTDVEILGSPGNELKRGFLGQSLDGNLDGHEPTLLVWLGGSRFHMALSKDTLIGAKT